MIRLFTATLALSVLPSAASQTALTAHQAEPIARSAAEAAVANPDQLALAGARAGRCQYNFCFEEPFDPASGTSVAWWFSYYTAPPEWGRRSEVYVIVRDSVGEVVGTGGGEYGRAEISDGWTDSGVAGQASLVTPHPEDTRWTGQAFIEGYPEPEVWILLSGNSPTWPEPGADWEIEYSNLTPNCGLSIGYAFSAYTGDLTGWSWGAHDGAPGSCPSPIVVPTEAVSDFTFALSAPSPNPAGPLVGISFELESRAPTRLDVLDATGRVVTTLMDRPLFAGSYNVVWETVNSAAGVYIVRLRSGEGERTALVSVIR